MKRVLIIIAAIVLVCCGGAAAVVTWLVADSKVDTFGKVNFSNRLAIPPIAPSHVDSDGRRVFDLTAQPGNHNFGSGKHGDTWGFSSDYLGPTLRASQGEQVVVNFHNELPSPTTVHWHGMHLPAAMDGGPHQSIEAGQTWSPTWKIAQPATTLWYHPHPHGETADQVYRGLAGLFILDGDEPASLPKTYGADDIPVIVQDKAFDGTGNMTDRHPFLSGVGILGNEIVVNGTYAPYQDVTTTSVRLRVLNASNARVYNFGFADSRSFSLIGTDGGLLDKPVPLDRIQLSPGERAEIVVTVKPGERPILRSYTPDFHTAVSFTKGGGDQFDVLQLRAANSLTPSPALPDHLSTVERLEKASVTRHLSLAGHEINGAKMDMNRVDFTATLGTTEIWEVSNQDGDPHSFHIHDVQFQILDAPPQLSGWKDTVFVPSDTRYRLIMRFSDYADPNTAYMYHCHVLYHEDEGMMGQFVVVQPGQSAGTVHQH